MKIMNTMRPTQIDLISITNQKRECRRKHKIQLPNFDKASCILCGFVGAAVWRFCMSFDVPKMIAFTLKLASTRAISFPLCPWHRRIARLLAAMLGWPRGAAHLGSFDRTQSCARTMHHVAYASR